MDGKWSEKNDTGFEVTTESEKEFIFPSVLRKSVDACGLYKGRYGKGY